MASFSITQCWRRLRLGLAYVVVLLPWLGTTGVTGWKTAECVAEIWQGRASLGWQQAAGRIDYSQVRVHTGGRGGKIYAPVVGYHYRAGGQVWHSRRIEATPNYSQMQAQQVVRLFPAGASVPVYHNGKGLSALRQGVRPMTYIGLVMWSLGCWLMAAMLWREWRRMPARIRIKAS